MAIQFYVPSKVYSPFVRIKSCTVCEYVRYPGALTPWCAIYVPTGTWHRVVPVTDEPCCLSMDIRVASATSARWLCENLFVDMTEHLRESDPRGEIDCTMCGDVVDPNSRQMKRIKTFAKSFVKRFDKTETRFDEMTRILMTPSSFATFVPRCLPFEDELTDGMALG